MSEAEELEATARVMAAGPDLLNALTAVMPLLEAVRMQVGFGPTQMKRIEAARAALSKARGEQQ